jgi:hypothetical protein
MASLLLDQQGGHIDKRTATRMSEVIAFPNRKQQVLRQALEMAEAAVTRTFSQADYLQRNGGSVAEQVKASLAFNRALSEFRRCETALAGLRRSAQG